MNCYLLCSCSLLIGQLIKLLYSTLKQPQLSLLAPLVLHNTANFNSVKNELMICSNVALDPLVSTVSGMLGNISSVLLWSTIYKNVRRKKKFLLSDIVGPQQSGGNIPQGTRAGWHLWECVDVQNTTRAKSKESLRQHDWTGGVDAPPADCWSPRFKGSHTVGKVC